MEYFWTIALVIFVIWFLSREPYFYDYYTPIASWVKLQWQSVKALWGEANFLKRTYIIAAGAVGVALLYLFARLYLEVLYIDWDDIGDDDGKIRNLAIAFVGTITGIGALFGVYLAILRSETNERQSHAAESRSKAAHDQNEITKRQNDLNERQNDLIEQQNKIATKQNKLATAERKTTERQADVAEKQAKIAEKQADTAEKGFLDGRFNNAIEGLGKNNKKGEPILEIRIAALYSLENIAQENTRDHIRIMETLCAYIQQNSPRDIEKETQNVSKPLRTDIQVALNIIGRHYSWSENKKRMKIELDQKYYITLWDCNLDGASFSDGNFNNARFNRSNLRNANFSHTKLVDARFPRTNLRNAMFFNTDMSDVKIRYANLSNAKIHGTNMSNAATDYLYAYTADFSDNTNITQEQIDVMYCGIGVKIPNGLTRPDHWTEDNLSYADFMETYREWLKRNGKKLENDPYIG